MWNLKKTKQNKKTEKTKNRVQMNLFTKQIQTHRHKKQTYDYQRGKGGT